MSTCTCKKKSPSYVSHHLLRNQVAAVVSGGSKSTHRYRTPGTQEQPPEACLGTLYVTVASQRAPLTDHVSFASNRDIDVHGYSVRVDGSDPIYVHTRTCTNQFVPINMEFLSLSPSFGNIVSTAPSPAKEEDPTAHTHKLPPSSFSIALSTPVALALSVRILAVHRAGACGQHIIEVRVRANCMGTPRTHSYVFLPGTAPILA